MSGYLVFPNSDSKTSNWARVKVVRSRLCFRGLTPKDGVGEREREIQINKFQFNDNVGVKEGERRQVSEMLLW